MIVYEWINEWQFGHVVCLRVRGASRDRLESAALAAARRLEIARTNVEECGRRPCALPHRKIRTLYFDSILSPIVIQVNKTSTSILHGCGLLFQ